MGKRDVDVKDDARRTEGIDDSAASTTKRLWCVVACVVPACQNSMAVPFGEAFRSEETFRRALHEHQGPVYASMGGWSLAPSRLTRTLQIPITGYAPLCPACTGARARKMEAHSLSKQAAAARAILRKVNDDA